MGDSENSWLWQLILCFGFSFRVNALLALVMIHLIHGSDDVFDVIVPLLKRLPPSLITGNLK
jgi:hypothetical protein